MLNKICEKKIDGTVEKVLETYCNPDKSNSNMAYICLKFVSFALSMD